MTATIQNTGDGLFPVRIVVRDDRGRLRFSKLGRTAHDAARNLVELAKDQPLFLSEIMQVLNNMGLMCEVEREVTA